MMKYKFYSPVEGVIDHTGNRWMEYAAYLRHTFVVLLFGLLSALSPCKIQYHSPGSFYQGNRNHSIFCVDIF